MLAKMVDSGTAPSAVTYTPLVRGFLRAGGHEKVSKLLRSMVSANCSPDIVLMDSMAKGSRYDEAEDIYMNIHGSQINRMHTLYFSSVITVLMGHRSNSQIDSTLRYFF